MEISKVHIYNVKGISEYYVDVRWSLFIFMKEWMDLLLVLV